MKENIIDLIMKAGLIKKIGKTKKHVEFVIFKTDFLFSVMLS